MGAILVLAGVIILLSGARGDPVMLGQLLINNMTGQVLERQVGGVGVIHNGPAILGRVALPVLILGIVGFYAPLQRPARVFTILLLLVIIVAVKTETGTNFVESMLSQVANRARGRPIDFGPPPDKRNPTEKLTDGLLEKARQLLQNSMN